ncbi:MAG: hypothetical protein LBE09_07625 [Christensenellaceae bacterium]|nr:hypothetical protein [Christensenellaceae bacterium]
MTHWTATADNINNYLDARLKRILEFCKTPLTRENMQRHLGITNRGYFRVNILNHFYVRFPNDSLPNKPDSSNQ